MNWGSVILNLVIIVGMTLSLIYFFSPHEGRTWWENGKLSLRYFTIQSNIVVYLAAIVMLVYQLKGNEIPFGVTLFKYVGTLLVTITFLVVMIYLGPVYGYKDQLSGVNFYVHVIGPLAALLSLCIFEKNGYMSIGQCFIAFIPALVYGIIYMYRVVISKSWDDFYGFATNTKWYISFMVLLVFVSLVCLGVRFLYNI